MIWQACNGERHLTPLSGTLFRLVESQEQAATLSLVDTLQEQALLEQLLEQTKPPVPPAAEDLHYLLKTPFRYPPLKWGSRFGSVYEPGIFYAGCSVAVTLAESAYYRMIFWQSMPTPAPKPILRTAHTLFSVSYQTERGIALHQPPFNQHQAQLTSKTDYQHTQQLGSAMRSAGVDAFEYQSARAPGSEHCIGLFNPSPFVTHQPNHSSQWLCELSAQQVVFKQHGETQLHSFSTEQFWVEGKLPLPA
uniref:RES domain-containing protein n=1 Tax=Rheinheimera sp. BAL341 TaxID=1708203 RepID=A0A486XM25_9GAMM